MEQLQAQMTQMLLQPHELQQKYDAAAAAAAAAAANAQLHQEAQQSATAATQAQQQAAAQAAQCAAYQAEQQAQQQQQQTQQHMPVVDARGIGKPSTFDPKSISEQSKFNACAFKLTNFNNGPIPHPRHFTKLAFEQSADISSIDVYRECTAAGITDVEADQAQTQLHALLVSVTEGEAATIVENSGEDNGLEAFRRLTRRYAPNNAGRKRAVLDYILALPRRKMAGLQKALENRRDEEAHHSVRAKTQKDFGGRHQADIHSRHCTSTPHCS